VLRHTQEAVCLYWSVLCSVGAPHGSIVGPLLARPIYASSIATVAQLHGIQQQQQQQYANDNPLNIAKKASSNTIFTDFQLSVRS